ncbi:MAG: hypothetical protein HONBIEJF_02473 [Fimbriimonadaceae bacterium]|nr:hypothetical protein [Fimbriimonadaceae bacterium]
MSLDSALLWSFLCVFMRLSAMLISSPLFGAANVPQKVRIGICLVLAMAVTPIVGQSVGTIPTDWYGVASRVAAELAVGLTMGLTLQLVLQALLMAGSLLDLQVGLGAAQTLNPVIGTQVTILSQFKFLLAVVILLLSNGHLMMLQAFVASYQVSIDIGLHTVPHMAEELVRYISALAILSMQVAAPVVAVGLVVDAAMGIVNKAVPQMQVFIVALPAKIAAGIVTLAVGLPMTVQAVTTGVDSAIETMSRMLEARPK